MLTDNTNVIMAESTSSARFPQLSEEDLNKILEKKDSENTKKATKAAVVVFEKFLAGKNEHLGESHWTELPKNELANLLRSFYAEARTTTGDFYKRTTMLSLRNGLNRHLNYVKRNNDPNAEPIDLTSDPAFCHANNMMKAMKKVLKENSKSSVDHHPPISTGDLLTLRKYFLENVKNNPKVLQEQVFVNIIIYFGRRGRENLRQLKVSDFTVTSDSSGRLYLYQVTDELTKNHQDDSDKKDARMYQKKGNSDLNSPNF